MALAGSVGVDQDEARAWLAGDEGVAEVRAAIGAAQRLGIDAVPTFVFDGKYAVQGAQEVPTFVDVTATGRAADLRESTG